MNEQQWLTLQDPAPMLNWLLSRPRPLVSGRKLRLWACACCRQVWGRLPTSSRDAVIYSEQYADNDCDAGVLDSWHEGQATHQDGWVAHYASYDDRAIAVGCEQIARFAGTVDFPDAASQAALLRCVCGNPFAPVFDAGCQNCHEPAPARGGPCYYCGLEVVPSALFTHRDGAAVNVARTIYETREWPALAVLADLVEEAGVENAALRAHLNGPGPHCRGCWALDLFLDPEAKEEP